VAVVHSTLSPDLQAFIAAQPVFFVATAPLVRDGHVNLSPKGLSSFRVLSPSRVAYLDLTGSGNETAAHAAENGRITFMFCAFEGPPRILRLYGQARAVQPASAEWADLAPHFDLLPGTRQLIVADLTRVQTSCGFGVPIMRLESHRDQLEKWVSKKGEQGLRTYRANKNARSIDGLPAPGEWDG
jgi:hypothetical protein